MEFQLPINIETLPSPIRYGQKILLVGSCFTEHIGNRLQEWKFKVLQNPHGILFEPHSVASSLISYAEGKEYGEADLFYHNECWQSWHHHSLFSGVEKSAVLAQINHSQQQARSFLKTADWLIVTLGSSFSYRLTNTTPADTLPPGDDRAVANCHRTPAQWFDKHLMDISETSALLENTITRLRKMNPLLNVIVTVSPVRHARDGVVENNRSKARLIESVHALKEKIDRVYYFPAYELVIDVLRDYRFYDIDMVHPNYPATEFVLEKFVQHCLDPGARPILDEVKKIVTARKHRPFQPSTSAHRQFLESFRQKTAVLQEKYAFLDLKEELDYFGKTQ